MKLGVYIGRFQPFHFGHLHAIETALEACDRLLIPIGSAGEPRSTRNPWTSVERDLMIRAGLPEEVLARIDTAPLHDWATDTTWAAGVRAAVRRHLGGSEAEGTEVLLAGYAKDHSSYYLGLFPEWGRIEVDNYQDLNATEIRANYFEFEWEPLAHEVPVGVRDWLAANWLPHFHGAATYLMAEFEAVSLYKARWEVAPYPPTFVTTDALVVSGDRVAIVQRGRAPFRGRWALPGGFLEPGLGLLDNALKEFGEECESGRPAAWLRPYLREVRVFDAPGRDPRGRFVTHVHLFEVPEGVTLPELVGGDDAEWAGWVPLSQVERGACAFDHFSIINLMAGIHARSSAILKAA